MQGDFRIGDWLVQPQLNLIVGSGRENMIEPKVMEVLVYLAERPGEVLHKERIIQGVWADTFVTDDVLIHAISQLRKAFRDDAKNPHVIQTIAKKGYCLIATVAKVQPEADARYRIVKKLGQGGMGEVFLADDRLLHRNVALKFIREDKESDRSYKKRLLREARSAAALDHPSIAKIHDMGERDGKSFIVMEYVEGVSLEKMLARGPLSMQEALRISVEMAEALEEAHNKGIVHRDFKSTNVHITSDGKVKVLDFGLAKAIDRVQTETEQSSIITTTAGTQTGLIAGTTPYMAPETLHGEPSDAGRMCGGWASSSTRYSAAGAHLPGPPAPRSRRRSSATLRHLCRRGFRAGWKRLSSAVSRRTRPSVISEPERSGPHSKRRQRPRCCRPGTRHACLGEPRWRSPVQPSSRSHCFSGGTCVNRATERHQPLSPSCPSTTCRVTPSRTICRKG